VRRTVRQSHQISQQSKKYAVSITKVRQDIVLPQMDIYALWESS